MWTYVHGIDERVQAAVSLLDKVKNRVRLTRGNLARWS